VQDATADGFGGVVSPVFDLPCLVTATGLGTPDFSVVGTKGDFEPAEALPEEFGTPAPHPQTRNRYPNSRIVSMWGWWGSVSIFLRKFVTKRSMLRLVTRES